MGHPRKDLIHERDRGAGAEIHLLQYQPIPVLQLEDDTNVALGAVLLKQDASAYPLPDEGPDGPGPGGVFRQRHAPSVRGGSGGPEVALCSEAIAAQCEHFKPQEAPVKRRREGQGVGDGRTVALAPATPRTHEVAEPGGVCRRPWRPTG